MAITYDFSKGKKKKKKRKPGKGTIDGIAIETSEFGVLLDELKTDGALSVTGESLDEYDDFFTGQTIDIVDRRRKVFKLKLAGLGAGDIAAALGVDFQVVCGDIRSIKDAMRRSVDRFDWPLYIGDSMRFFHEVMNKAMSIGQNSNNDLKHRLTAFKLALESKDREIQFFQKLGVIGKNTADKLHSEDLDKDKEVDDFSIELMAGMKKHAKKIQDTVIEVHAEETKDMGLDE